MANELLELDPSPHEVAFDVIVDRLKRHDPLKNVIRTWLTWDGSPLDGRELVLSRFPLLALTPGPIDGVWTTENEHTTPLAITIEIGTLGTRVANPLRIFHAIKNALFVPPYEYEEAGSKVYQINIDLIASEPLRKADAAIGLITTARITAMLDYTTGGGG